uniref:Uncharacterized protein n=1 Tax=Glycine max TaxID=3847 RepID=A0A0R0HWX9_SOYBN
MGGSVFTHFLVLPSSSTPSLSTLFPSKFPTRPINESFPFTLTCNQFPSKLTTSRPSQFSAPPSYSCSVKKIKASGSQQTGSIRHGDNLDAMNSRSLLQKFQRKMPTVFLFNKQSMRSGTFFVIRQVLVRRELDLSAKELQEQVRSGDAGATELFELGAVMLRRKFYPAATKFLLQAIEKWDGDNPDLAQVYNALGVSYVRDGKVDKGIAQFETAVKLQPGYVTAWNNLGDAFESKKDYKSALKAFEEVLLFDPNNKVARPRRDSLKGLVDATKGVTVIKSTEKK